MNRSFRCKLFHDDGREIDYVGRVFGWSSE